MMFATAGDLEKFTGTPTPEEEVGDALPGMLRRASTMVRHAVRYAVFDTTPAGAPVDPDIADALRDATCAQVACWVDSGLTRPGRVDTTAGVASTSLDGASLNYDVDGAAGRVARLSGSLCEEARWILDNAGLTGGAVWAL